MTDRGYNKSCVFEIDEDVIRKQHSIDISCALLQDGGIAMHEKFRLPACSDVSSGMHQTMAVSYNILWSVY